MSDISQPPCRVCRHRATGSCPGCGGVLGAPWLGLPPCKVCPTGRKVADEPPPIDAMMAASIAANMPPDDTYYVQPPHWPTYYPDEPLPPGPEESTPYTWPEWMPPPNG